MSNKPPLHIRTQRSKEKRDAIQDIVTDAIGQGYEITIDQPSQSQIRLSQRGFMTKTLIDIWYSWKGEGYTLHVLYSDGEIELDVYHKNVSVSEIQKIVNDPQHRTDYEQNRQLFKPLEVSE